jgi:phospholipid N-methyltransferase
LAGSTLRAQLLFARTFLKHPLMLGSVIPSSRALVNRVLEQIDWSATRVIVEYGPGVGTITSAILQNLRSDGVIVAIDYNPDFADYLRQSTRDPRLKVVHGSAADVERILESVGLEGADCIVSGIPFSTLPHGLRQSLLEDSRRVLLPGGKMIVYQFTGAVLPHLEQVFGEVSQQRELMNILPARVFSCSR